MWNRHCFAWEYKGRRADLDAAFNQLRQYALALENPPLLIVSDMVRFRIRTNWTNSVSRTHEFTREDLADAGIRDKLMWAMSDPVRLPPGESRQALTERAAASFAEFAQSLRERGHEPQHVAHFVNRMVFYMFAEDVRLLPGNMFTRMFERARRRPDEFTDLSRELFGAMASGGRIEFEAVAWFNGGLFDDDETPPLEREEIDVALKAAALDWSEIEPSIVGTLFEPGQALSTRRALHRAAVRDGARAEEVQRSVRPGCSREARHGPGRHPGRIRRDHAHRRSSRPGGEGRASTGAPPPRTGPQRRARGRIPARPNDRGGGRAWSGEGCPRRYGSRFP